MDILKISDKNEFAISNEDGINFVKIIAKKTVKSTFMIKAEGVYYMAKIGENLILYCSEDTLIMYDILNKT